MSKLPFHPFVRFIRKTLLIHFILAQLNTCDSTHVISKIQGQEATLDFPYPCDSTEVTLQQSDKPPFYTSTDKSILSLPADQIDRFQVEERIENGNCSLKLTISNLMIADEGLFLSTVYKEGLPLDDFTAILLRINYPPGEASCAVGEEDDGDWVSLDCTANAGSLPGKIECYQNGVWMPPLTDAIENDTLLKQTIRIRKSKPVFCCSSVLNKYKFKCECNDTVLFLIDNHSNHPCPASSEMTTKSIFSSVKENNQSDVYSMTSSTPAIIEVCKHREGIIITLSVLFAITFLLFIMCCCMTYVMTAKYKSNEDYQDSLMSLLQMTLIEKDEILNLLELSHENQERVLKQVITEKFFSSQQQSSQI